MSSSLHHITNFVSTDVRASMDVGAVGLLGGTYFGWLPQATAILTFVWVCIRLYETATFQRLLKRVLARFGITWEVRNDVEKDRD